MINRLEVTVDSEDQLTQLTQAADRHEAASIGSIEFEHSAKKALQQQVRNAALDDAVAQGTAYADKLALELQAVSFQYADIRPERPRSAMVIEEIVVTAQKSLGFSAGTPAPPPPPMTFDEAVYKAMVDVVFEVSPRSTQ